MKKILIVDDEPHISLIMKQHLTKAGYQVKTALNGIQALQQIEKELPDVIVTDIQMPKMNGIQLCDEILLEQADYKGLIIIMTSRTDQDIRHWVSHFPKIKLMEKPLSLRRLTGELEEYFQTRVE